MAEETDPVDDPDALDTAAVFSLLGEDARLAIVRVLHRGPVDTPVAFSDLYDHVDVDDTARFNYHLGKLRPHFVAKAGDGGYELTSAGRRLARAVTAARYTEVPSLDPFAVDDRCYSCGQRSLWAAYGDETFSIDCRNCDQSVLSVRVPPTVVRGRDPDDVVDAFERWSTHQVDQAIDGVCPDCGGPVDPGIREGDPFDAVAVFECDTCGRRAVTSFGSIAGRHPAVESFRRRRGDPLDDRRLWEVDQLVGGGGVEVLSRDPLSVRVTFRADGDACHVEVGDDLAVERVEVVPGGAESDP